MGEFKNSMTNQIMELLERDSDVNLDNIDENELRLSIFDGYKEMVNSQIKIKQADKPTPNPENEKLQSKLRFIASKLIPKVRQFMKTEWNQKPDVDKLAKKLKNTMSVIHFKKKRKNQVTGKGSVVIKNRFKLPNSPFPSEIHLAMSNRLRDVHSEPDNQLKPFSGYNSTQNLSRNSVGYSSNVDFRERLRILEKRQ